MSDEQQNDETEAPADADVEAKQDGEDAEPKPEDAESKDEDEGAAEAEAEAKDDAAGDEDEDEEEDEDKEDKPKKVKIEFEATMPRGEAVSYFEAIVGGLRSGRLEFRQEGNNLVLSPPDQLSIEVKAQRKGNKGKVVFEIEWSDENRPLEILN